MAPRRRRVEVVPLSARSQRRMRGLPGTAAGGGGPRNVVAVVRECLVRVEARPLAGLPVSVNLSSGEHLLVCGPVAGAPVRTAPTHI